MKTPISYFLLALTISLVATTWSVQGQVFDTDGDIITKGNFYVLPFLRGQGGGVSIYGKCIRPTPFNIVQQSSELDKGLPVKFSNWMGKVEFVPLNSNLNIETVVEAMICMQPTYWWVDMFGFNKDRLLITGPKPEGYGKNSWNSYFQIAETDDKYVYKIVMCPAPYASNEKLSMPFCGNVGIFDGENGVRSLGINFDKPFLVQFKKANVIENVLSKNM